MKTSQNGLTLIENSEGLRTEVYNDAAGVPTVGYGHKILIGEDFSGGITQEQAQEILANDVAKVETVLNDLIPSNCTQNQWDACIDFGFNLGNGNLRTMLGHGWDEVPQQMPKWVYAGGVVEPGLVARRAAEVALFTTPEA